ncbi:hypothetical protein [Streptomyces sp. NPDC050560]|uniref:hypothetical protein n=1 Tax=Streptomyces sp. NPDC050560 TaxID=3365630 RepID=UPI0037AF3089
MPVAVGGRGGAGAGGGSGGREWLTMVGGKRVLAIVHTLTYLKRIVEVLDLLEGDFRIQVLCTTPPHVFGTEVPRFLHRLGLPVVPWESAKRMTFDLALAAGPGGVSEISAPLVALSHGAAYLKRITEAGPAEYGVAGLRRRDVMPDGRTLPAALVLPHRAELRELARTCPEALPVARVIGDPVYDRITDNLPLRANYRRALGVSAGQELVTVVSTWGRHSSFGRIDALLPRLTTELRGDHYRTAILVHPNVWSGHGHWQMRSWLAEARRRGVALIPPGDDWRPWLIASDHIIGDHGSVTVYGTLTNAPILLASSPREEINPASPAATLARTAPELSPVRPLAEQLSYAASDYRRSDYAAIAARLTSHPGGFARGMRRLLYELLGIPRLAHEPAPAPLPPPSPPGGSAGVWEESA